MIKVFSLTNLNVEYITDYQGLAIFQQIQNYLLPINNGSLENIAILDMDADKDIILSELQVKCYTKVVTGVANKI